MTSRTLAKLVANGMLSKKASDIAIMDIRKVTDTADFFVVCSADSEPQVRAIADAIEEETEKSGMRLWQSEGRDSLSWVILDYVDVVAHVFRKDTRAFYNLERLWSDAKITHIQDDAPSSTAAPASKKRRVSAPRATTRKRTRS